MTATGPLAQRVAGLRIAGLRVAVTGASGFCGGAVARAAAAAGAEVVCLGRRPGPAGVSRHWDATRALPDLTGTDLVIHLAAAVGDPPPGRTAEAAFRAVNVDGTVRLLEAAGTRPVVWVSSASVYAAPGAAEQPASAPGATGQSLPAPGAAGQPTSAPGTTGQPASAPGAAGQPASAPGRRRARPPLQEDHPIAGMTAYGRTKAAGERLALDAGAVVLRPRAVYGPGDPHLLPRLRRAVRGGRVLLPGPDIQLSLTAVENLADACLAAHAWPPGAYNIADAPAYQRDEVIAAACGVPVRHLSLTLARAAAAASSGIARLTHREPTLSRYALEQLTTPVVLDISRARAQGWTPTRTFTDFLRVK